MRPLLAGLAVLALAACSAAPKGSPVAEPAPTPAPSLAVGEGTTREAIDLLTQGRPVEARSVLYAVLVAEPDNAVAKRLMQQLDQEPAALLPGKTQTYTVGPGETFSMLAGRFLGDPLLFYALAKYNGFAAPAHLQAGYVLKIPKRPAPVVASRGPAKPPRAAPKGEPAAPAAVAVARDSGRAGQLRAQGLDQLNRGAPARAVALLQQAAQLDPANPAIQRDLVRAQRIHASVAAR